MVVQSIDEQIAELERQILELKAKKHEAEKVEYPKWIPDPNDLEGKSGRSVDTAEEEKRVVAGYEKAAAASKKRIELEKKIKALREEHDKLTEEPVAVSPVTTKRAPRAAKVSKAPKVSKAKRRGK